MRRILRAMAGLGAATAMSLAAWGCTVTSAPPIPADQLRTADRAALEAALRSYSGTPPAWRDREGWPNAVAYRGALKAELLSRHAEWPAEDRARWVKDGPERGMPFAAAEIVLGTRRGQPEIRTDASGEWARASYGPNSRDGRWVYTHVTYFNGEVFWWSESTDVSFPPGR